MPCLELDGELRELDPETTIGSGAQASWRIASKDLAGRHFALRLDGASDARLVPASGHSVVALNGRQVPTGGVTLSSGDVITAGSARFVYLRDRSAPRPGAPAPAGESYLVDGRGGQAYHLRKRTVQIGREAANGIVLRDPAVSRFHADVRAESGGHVLYSSGASGSLLNGVPVAAPRLLEEGDQVRIGDTTFTFTRSLPPGVRVVTPTEREEDRVSMRPTVVARAVITDEVAGTAGIGAARLNPMVIGAAVAAALAVLVALLR